MKDITFKSRIPAGKKGRWAVEKFTIPKSYTSGIGAMLEGLREERDFGENRRPLPGRYTRLVRDGETVVMSDTRAELNDHRPLMEHAQGHVLIFGLGLGIATELCLRHPKVTAVTTVEISEDVQELVGMHIKSVSNKPLTMMLGDAFTWKPPSHMKRFDTIWSDIWDTISADNVDEMLKLKKRYAKYIPIWHGFWGSKMCLQMKAYEEAEARDFREVLGESRVRALVSAARPSSRSRGPSRSTDRPRPAQASARKAREA